MQIGSRKTNIEEGAWTVCKFKEGGGGGGLSRKRDGVFEGGWLIPQCPLWSSMANNFRIDLYNLVS